ncbi:MAG: hypothetical protein AAGI90_03410 [Chlamydiota bacterium]
MRAFGVYKSQPAFFKDTKGPTDLFFQDLNALKKQTNQLSRLLASKEWDKVSSSHLQNITPSLLKNMYSLQERDIEAHFSDSPRKLQQFQQPFNSFKRKLPKLVKQFEVFKESMISNQQDCVSSLAIYSVIVLISLYSVALQCAMLTFFIPLASVAKWGLFTSAAFLGVYPIACCVVYANYRCNLADPFFLKYAINEVDSLVHKMLKVNTERTKKATT